VVKLSTSSGAHQRSPAGNAPTWTAKSLIASKLTR
jgi:hypothetical protein